MKQVRFSNRRCGSWVGNFGFVVGLNPYLSLRLAIHSVLFARVTLYARQYPDIPDNCGKWKSVITNLGKQNVAIFVVLQMNNDFGRKYNYSFSSSYKSKLNQICLTNLVIS